MFGTCLIEENYNLGIAYIWKLDACQGVKDIKDA
jgi:hypothetical protein